MCLMRSAMLGLVFQAGRSALCRAPNCRTILRVMPAMQPGFATRMAVACHSLVDSEPVFRSSLQAPFEFLSFHSLLAQVALPLSLVLSGALIIVLSTRRFA